MFGNTISLDIGPDGDSNTKTLKLVNEGGFQTEYRLVETDRAFTVQIRHSTEKAKVRGRLMDRHNVTFRQELFPTAELPEGMIHEVYTVFRVPQGVVPSSVQPLSNGVLRFARTNDTALAGWES